MHVSIDLYSLTGRHVRAVVNQEFSTGSHDYSIQAHDLASGIYFIRTSFNGSNHMWKVILLK
jgi:hypothetical protein